MNPVSDTDRRLSVLHIFKIYYPDLFGGTLSVIRDVCASLKDKFAFGILVCSRLGGRRQIVVNEVPVERVRLGKEKISGEEQVTDQVRKEQIETDDQSGGKQR